MRNVVALYNIKDQFIGYFVADDELITEDINRAASFPSSEVAEANAIACNKLWNLGAGEKFRASVI